MLVSRTALMHDGAKIWSLTQILPVQTIPTKEIAYADLPLLRALQMYGFQKTYTVSYRTPTECNSHLQLMQVQHSTDCTVLILVWKHAHDRLCTPVNSCTVITGSLLNCQLPDKSMSLSCTCNRFSLRKLLRTSMSTRTYSTIHCRLPSIQASVCTTVS